MEFLHVSFSFLIGLGVGSFLNVLVLRLGTGKGVVATRSHCFACGKTLTWHELIPLVSFLAQKGRCRKCGSRISWQYPVVEFMAGLLFVLIATKVFQSTQFSMFSAQAIFNSQFSNIRLVLELFYWWVVCSILLAIAIYDLRHMVIPNQFVYPFIALAFIGMLVFSIEVRLQYYIVTGVGAFAFFALLWLVSRGRWMGFGDAKLALGIGFLLGPANTALAVVLSFWFGTLVAIPLLVLKKKDRTSHIPFAPFLVMGAFTSWLIGERIIAWYFGLF